MSTAMSAFARTVFENRYAWTVGGRKETLQQVGDRVASNVLAAVGAPKSLVREAANLIAERKFLPGGRYLANTGRDEGVRYTNNCFLMRAEDTREGWGQLADRVMVASMTGGGVGVDYSGLRHARALLRRTGGFSSGPLPLMCSVNEVGRGAVQGGSRRAALWAGLKWNHPDIREFITMKDWPAEIRALKAKDVTYPAPMDGTNISVILDDAFFVAYAAGDATARDVYWSVVRHACETGEPGFSVDVGSNAGENLRNPCCEVTSRDDSDVCCLGSINLARIESLSEMRRVTEVATAFLLAGTVYSDVPYAKVAGVREKNRRLGLGLMGVHEFQMASGNRYGDRLSLAPYLDSYAWSGRYAERYAKEWGLSVPVKTRAIAPAGTIGIVAETTTGIEPIFAKAYKRRYYDHGVVKMQYVIDPTARRMFTAGRADVLEDAYDLAADVERRVAFQAYTQLYVDHGISSTVNLPSWGSPQNNEETVYAFGEMLLRHLPGLRGMTVYPDGARGGQPLTPAPLEEALAREGEVVTEQADVCELRSGGSCGA